MIQLLLIIAKLIIEDVKFPDEKFQIDFKTIKNYTANNLSLKTK